MSGWTLLAVLAGYLPAALFLSRRRRLAGDTLDERECALVARRVGALLAREEREFLRARDLSLFLPASWPYFSDFERTCREREEEMSKWEEEMSKWEEEMSELWAEREEQEWWWERHRGDRIGDWQ